MTNTSKLIIYIGNFELPDKNAAAQRVLSNGKILRDLGYKVVYIGKNKQECHDNILKNKNKYYDFDVWETPYPTSKIQWLNQITTPVGLEKVINQYPEYSLHSILCYNYPAIAQNKIKYLCKKHKAFYIPDVTEWYGNSGRGMLVGSIKWLDTILRMKVFNFQADALITTSTYLTNYYRPKVMNIIELPTLYDSESLSSNLKNKISKNEVRVLYAGNPFGSNMTKTHRHHVKDRLDKVITLISQLKHVNYKLVVYGLTKERYLQIYPEHEETLQEVKDKIVFKGTKTHSEIINAIKKSHFTIFFRDVSRLTEAGFPSKLSESITFGTPVITNRISNLEPYLNIKKIINLVDLDNNESGIQQLEKLLTWPHTEILSIKKECNESSLFDYRSYIPRMNAFLNKLEDLKD